MNNIDTNALNAPAGIDIKKETSGKKDSPAEIKKAVTDFEALFINQMLKTMRETIKETKLFHGESGGGSGEDTYTSMFDAELSKLIAKGGGIGLSKILMNQLSMPGQGEKTMPYSLVDKPAPDDSGAASSPVNTPAPRNPNKAPAIGKGRVRLEPFKMPIHGKISSGFGIRNDPFTGDVKFHHGIDIAAAQGSAIYPVAGGKVTFSGIRGGYGNVVEVTHDNGYVTRYGHNQTNLVRVGDAVSTTDPIAYVGSTGRSTGPHLHFEVLKNGSPVDPGNIDWAG